MKEIIKSYGGTVAVFLVSTVVLVQLARRSAFVRAWFTA